MQTAIKYGKTVLVENVGDNINQHLQTIFRNDIYSKVSNHQIEFAGIGIPFDPNFKLYVTTEL